MSNILCTIISIIVLIFIILGILMIAYLNWLFNKKCIDTDNDEINISETVLKIQEELHKQTVDAAHSKAKLTPEEKVKYWEGLGLCAPGDAIGSAAWRCEKFKDCHECLVDYAHQNNDYDLMYKELDSICKELKVANSAVREK